MLLGKIRENQPYIYIYIKVSPKNGQEKYNENILVGFLKLKKPLKHGEK